MERTHKATAKFIRSVEQVPKKIVSRRIYANLRKWKPWSVFVFLDEMRKG